MRNLAGLLSVSFSNISSWIPHDTTCCNTHIVGNLMYHLPKLFHTQLYYKDSGAMSTWQILVSVLLLIHPAQSQFITSTCEIPSVEAGENATVTIHFGQDFRKEKIRDFTLEHIGHSSTASQTRLLDCEFSYGNVTCKKTSCCTWESHVTDVFRVYIHNVSQELEGRFFGFVIPGDTAYQRSCNFSLKASACHTDLIFATNSHMICKNQPVTIGQNCTVTCIPGHYFQENQTSVMYTCVGKNKWSPEMWITSCEGQAKGQATSSLYSLFLLLLLIPIGIFFFWWWWKTQKLKEELSLLQRTQEGVINWIECILKWYPDLQSRTYFLPPHQFNQVLCCQQSVAGNLAPVLQTPQDSDVRDDRALKRVLLCLHALAHNSRQADNSQETDNPQETDKLLQANNPQETDKLLQANNPQETDKLLQASNPQETDKLQQADNSQQAHNPQQEEVMMIISQLQFGKYIGQPSYAGALALLPLYSKRSGLLQRHYDKGDCDVLIIHKTLGLLTLQITSVGENFSQLEMTKQKQDDEVMKKVKEAVKQLNKAEADLKHLTSDIADIKHITKILVLPNINSNQLLHAINRFPSDAKFLCECLGAKSVDDALKLCLLKDQLSDNQTPSDINPSSLQALREWWQHVVRASKSGSLLTPSLYEQLVARFCGPATTVEVHCVTAPRLNIRTLGKAVSETGERVSRLVLFPQQVDILNQSLPRAFLCGPPGTGKTIVLIMQGLTWIQRGYDVHVISTWNESRAATFVIEHQLQETAKTPTAKSRVHRHHFDFWKDGDVEAAVSCLKSLSEGRQLCVIADEVMHYNQRKPFTEFCDQLIKVPGVFIWGASLYNDVRPLCLVEVKLTTPLRSPPVIVREVMEAKEIKNKEVDEYTVSDVPVPTDGPKVIRIEHHDGQLGHTRDLPRDCVECGRDVARVLTKLNVGQTGDSNGHPPLQYRDVLVLCFNYPTDERVVNNSQMSTTINGLVRGLRDSHVPVRVVKKGDEAAIRDTALGVGDRVTVACWDDVRGLERKVVVVASGIDMIVRLRALSRCTSQLVVIDR